MIPAILGGVGIFLVGMILLTEGLKAAAGGALRTILQRFTRGRLSAFLSGAGVTALVQSSSATTLTTIGFVSAGLLTFPQAVGVLFGANVGTTSTGWIVSVLGLKVQVSAVALPAVGVGALMRLLARGRAAHWGMALAGFGLIFVGIDALQVGMEGLAERFDPGAFPAAGAAGRLLLVVIGAAMTVVMQSSSAAVATTLTALHSGAIGIDQAAFLVIGQNVGTTVKSALAALGASVPARRTAVAHVLFNFFTAGVAFVAAPLLLALSVGIAGPQDPTVAIAVFHTAFNLLGVGLLFPVVGPFSRLVERLVPERHPSLVRHLDRSVLEVPPVAVEAARRSVQAVAAVLLRRCRALLASVEEGAPARPRPAAPEADLHTLALDLDRIREFLGRIRTSPEQLSEYGRHLSVLHAVDHVDRFRDALDHASAVASRPQAAAVFREGGEPLVRALPSFPEFDVEGAGAADGPGGPDPWELERAAKRLATLRKERRHRILDETARGGVAPLEARERIEAWKVLDRLAYHAWRASHHLRMADAGAGDPVPQEDGAGSRDDREATGEALVESGEGAKPRV